MTNFRKLIDQTYSYFIEESGDIKDLYWKDFLEFKSLAYVINSGYNWKPTLDRMGTVAREQAYSALEDDGLL